jgi:hypothetical protein
LLLSNRPDALAHAGLLQPSSASVLTLDRARPQAPVQRRHCASAPTRKREPCTLQMASAGRVIAGCRETETRLAPPVTWNTLPTLATTMFARLYDARSFVTAALRSIGSALQANTTVETVPRAGRH